MNRSLAIALSIALAAGAAGQPAPADDAAGPQVSITVATGAPVPRERMPGSGEVTRPAASRSDERMKLATASGATSDDASAEPLWWQKR